MLKSVNLFAGVLFVVIFVAAMSQTLTLLRYACDQYGTWGVLLHGGTWVCHSLEPANRDGGYHHAVSAGVYGVSMYPSQRFGRKLPLLDVPGRSGILIHAGNHSYDSVGCILVGLSRCESMLLQSRPAVEKVVSLIREHDILQIEVINYESISR